MTDYIIRRETPADYRQVEELTREAFWNEYVLGCSEHYFVHTMRKHKDFVPELAFVLEKDGAIVGSVMYAKAALIADDGETKTVLSLGPICMHPTYQRQGGSRLLLEHSFEKASAMGYEAVACFGHPCNYINRGFVSCKRKQVYMDMGEKVYPTALLIKELVPHALQGKAWEYKPGDIDSCCEDTAAVAAFDAQFPPKEKAWQPSQEEFYIYSHSCVVR